MTGGTFLLVSLLLATASPLALSEETASLCLMVKDAISGRPVPSARVLLHSYIGPHGDVVPVKLALSYTTDAEGKATVPRDTLSLSISRPGYRPLSIRVTPPADTCLVVMLEPRPYDLEEVVVSTLRIPQSLLHSPVSTNVVGSEELKRLPVRSLAGVLERTRGFHIKSYGGPEGLRTVSQRGMGAEHTLIMLDGMPVNSLVNGSLDLGSLGIPLFSSVEMVYGGQSASFGGGAVAGVVNVLTTPGPDEGIARLEGTFGSAGYTEGSGSLMGRWEGGSLKVLGTALHSEGNYPFEFTSGPASVELRRVNADISSWNAGVFATIPAGSAMSLTATGLAQWSDRGVPAPVVSTSQRSRARQRDENLLTQVGLGLKGNETWGSDTKIQYQDSYQRYNDPDLVIGFEALDTYLRARTLRAEERIRWKPSKEVSVSCGVEALLGRGSGSSLASDPSRTQLGVYAVGEYHVIDPIPGGESFALFPGLRYDYVAEGPDALSPQLAAQWIPGNLTIGRVGTARPRVHASLSRNFRAPTFNELYYSGGGGYGNPSLEPERSTSSEIGLGCGIEALGDHDLQVTMYQITMENRIVWVAAGGGGVSPKNIRSVRSRGLEVSYRWDLPLPGVVIRGSYTYCDCRKTAQDDASDLTSGTQLIYVPFDQGTAELSYADALRAGVLRGLAASLGLRAVGFRYVTEDNTSYLPGYTLVDLSLRLEFVIDGVHSFTKMEVNNVGDTQYQVMLGYPMPGRVWRASLGFLL